MGKNVAVFVDVANIFYAAKAAGVDIDYVTLLKSASAGRDLVRAYAYTGLDPDNENQRNFHDFLRRSNYKVVSKDIRKYGDGKVKANLDIELVVDMMKTARNLDIAIVVSGDGDFAPAIRAVQEQGVRVEVISFRGNTSSDLIEVADQFTDIIQLARVEKGSRSGRRVSDDDADLSMTEVPDKQTEGVGGSRGRGRGRGRGRAGEAEPSRLRRPAVVVAVGRSQRAARPPAVSAGAGADRRAPRRAALQGARHVCPRRTWPQPRSSPSTIDDAGVAATADGSTEPPAASTAMTPPAAVADVVVVAVAVAEAGRGRGRGAPGDAGGHGRRHRRTADQTRTIEEERSSTPQPAPGPRATPFGSVWDSQLGTPTRAGRGPAPLVDDEDFDEPEIPEYLIAEQRRGDPGGAGGWRRRWPARRPGRVSVGRRRERYGGGRSGGINRYPDVSGRTAAGRTAAAGRPRGTIVAYDSPRQARRAAPRRRRSGEPWSDVRPSSRRSFARSWPPSRR